MADEPAVRRTLTRDEFRQLLRYVPQGTTRRFWVSRWAPTGFGLLPNGWVWATPDLWERAKHTAQLLNEAKPRTRRAAFEVSYGDTIHVHG